jgi:hypothetical protein
VLLALLLKFYLSLGQEDPRQVVHVLKFSSLPTYIYNFFLNFELAKLRAEA